MSTEDKQPAVFKKLGELRPDTAGHNVTIKVVHTCQHRLSCHRIIQR